MHNQTTLENLLKRDKITLISSIAGITIVAWLYLYYLALGMDSMSMDHALDMPQMHHWGSVEFLLMFIMWVVMMIGMMLPSASPMILLFAAVNRKRREKKGLYVPTAFFASGYIFVWACFSILATLAQWKLHTLSLLSSMNMASTSPVLGGVILIGAGIFQWTSLKYACLTHCRSPLDFLMQDWREGQWGAFTMGVKHGGYCLGCCWVLMLILFVTGVMNLLWVAIIAAFVFLEKAARSGLWIGRVAGILLIGWGVWIITEKFFFK